MSTSRILVAAAAVALATTAAHAQPSDRQVKKDLTGTGTISVKLVGKGTVQGNTDTMTYEYVRGAEIVEKSEYAGIKLIVIGDAVYQKTGGKYRYWKFRVIENRYDGLPNPSEKEILAVLDTDLGSKFGRGIASSIVEVIEPPRLAKDPQWVWHDPKSVSFQMTAKVGMVATYTEVETTALALDVRLYRDDMKGPWKGFLVSPNVSERSGRTKYTQDEIDNMPRLSQQAAEVAVKAKLAALPAVTIPAFASLEELARFVHRTLRAGPRDKAEAVLRALVAPHHLQGGSTVLLSSSAEEMIVHALDSAYGTATYAEQYCGEALFDARGSRDRFAITGVKDNLVSEIVGIRAGGTLVDGVETGAKWMLEQVTIRVRDDDATRKWVASFSDRKKLCPKD